MKTDGIIFDFNGTLFFDTEYHVEAWDSISFELTGKHLTRHTLETEYSGMPNIETLRKMTNNTLTDEQLEYYSQKKEAMYRDAVAKTPGGAELAPGAEEFFDFLKQRGIPFTIASSSIIENISFFVKTFRLDRWIDPVDIIYDDGSYTDKVQMFLDAAEKIHAKDKLLIFEDSLSGIKAASKVNANIIAVYSEQIAPYYKDYPQIIDVIRDFSEVEGLF